MVPDSNPHPLNAKESLLSVSYRGIVELFHSDKIQTNLKCTFYDDSQVIEYSCLRSMLT